MDTAVLLRKLIESQKTDLVIYNAYINSVANISPNFNAEDSFTQCMNDLKILSQTQEDFDKLTQGATAFGIFRREYRALCDMVCVMLGDKIKEICCRPVFVKPSQYENFCPFGNEHLVMYCTHPFSIGNSISSSDKELYTIEDVRLEDTPYYTLHIHKIEKLK